MTKEAMRYSVSIGRRIYTELQKQKLSQSVFANRCGISESTLSRYLSGERLMRIDQLVKISDELGLSIQYLITGVQ